MGITNFKELISSFLDSKQMAQEGIESAEKSPSFGLTKTPGTLSERGRERDKIPNGWPYKKNPTEVYGYYASAKIPKEWLYEFLQSTPPLYHIFLRGNNGQSLVYDSPEFIHFINRMALAAHAKGVTIWAYTFLSNHFHILAQPLEDEEQITKFKHHLRMSLTSYYNEHNASKGIVGTRRCDSLKITATPDLSEPKDIISYILRNSIRHNILKDNPFEYKWCSINSYFREEIKHNSYLRSTLENEPLIHPHKIASFIPNRTFLPDNWKMNHRGQILDESFLATSLVESLFDNYTSFKRSMFTPGDRELFNIEKNNVNYDKENIKRTFPKKTGKHSLTKNQGKNTSNINNPDSTTPTSCTAHNPEVNTSNTPNYNLYNKRASTKEREPVKISDIQVSEYINTMLDNIKIPALKLEHRVEVAHRVRKLYPQATFVQLSRILLIPRNTLYRVWNKY